MKPKFPGGVVASMKNCSQSSWSSLCSQHREHREPCLSDPGKYTLEIHEEPSFTLLSWSPWEMRRIVFHVFDAGSNLSFGNARNLLRIGLCPPKKHTTIFQCVKTVQVYGFPVSHDGFKLHCRHPQGCNGPKDVRSQLPSHH